MKFLVDNQLPAALVAYFRNKGLDCEHVLDAGLAEATDAELCRYASANEQTVISKDEDFLYLLSRPNVNIQFIWVRLGNCRTPVLLEAFERAWPILERSLKAGERIVEIR